jgi:hypothetical protein
MQAAALRQEEQLAAQLEAQRRRRVGRAEKEREREREREVERGTQFTCCTGTRVQILHTSAGVC